MGLFAECALDDRLVAHLWEHTFVRMYSFSITEHDVANPWLVVGENQRRTIELEDDENFFLWAAREYPRDRFTVELDPYQ